MKQRRGNKNRCIISGMDAAQFPFGHNEDARPCQIIKNALLNAIVALHKEGVDEFYTNCEYGFPLWGGEIVAALMLYNDIRLYVIQPHEDQAYVYDDNLQERFYKVHERSTDVIPAFISYDEDGNRVFLNDIGESLLFRRADDYMLADCGRLLFCGDEQGSYLYERAVELGLEITRIEV